MEHLRRAVDELGRSGMHVKRLSSLYETEPVGIRAQPWFLNLIVEAETDLFPLQLLDRLQSIELSLGRRRTLVRGPRTIDIDIVFYGGFRIKSERLVVPHPRLEQRRFVLEPLAELAPDLRHAVSHRTVREMLATTPDHSAVRRLSDSSIAPPTP